MQGVGKSQLILALAQYFEPKGFRCAGQDPDIFYSLEQARETAPGADMYFIEHQSMKTVKAGPGDVVIRMDRVTDAPTEQGLPDLSAPELTRPATNPTPEKLEA